MMQLDGKRAIMEVDTGAVVSVKSSKSLNSLFPRATLQKTTVRLRTYMAKEMPVMGQRSVGIRYGSYNGKHMLYVVKRDGPCLLGRDWLEHIQLDWASIKAVYMNKTLSKTEALVQRCLKVVWEQ